jgi:hypothetical protein
MSNRLVATTVPCRAARKFAVFARLPHARAVQVASYDCCRLQIAPAEKSKNRMSFTTIERAFAVALFLADTAIATNLAAG